MTQYAIKPLQGQFIETLYCMCCLFWVQVKYINFQLRVLRDMG